MNVTLRRLTTLLLAAAMSLSLLCTNAWAAEIIPQENRSALAAQNDGERSLSALQIGTVTETYVNPLYADVIDADDLLAPHPSNQQLPLASEADYYTSVAEAGAAMREGMEQREETIQIPFIAEEYSSDLVHAISDQAQIHTGVPTQGDYLKWQYAGWSTSTSGYISNGMYYLTITYTVTYYTTREQEEQVDQAVSDVIAELNVSDENDYTKVCAIYDYICDHTVYDYANLNDDSYKLKYTAYGALVDGTSVCQGYAVLFYRLALELGVDARLISGTGNGGRHAWNIVALNQRYYNVDATWDANRYTYSYFLKCDANFSGHIRDEEYSTEEFYSEYPMGTSDFDPSMVPDTPENPFRDVTDSDYYFDAVMWAYQNGITTGRMVDEVLYFMPVDSCTRAQAVTFLWRTMGEPEPETKTNPFTDIYTTDYYYKAVLWAYETGITTGKNPGSSALLFGPNDFCTRAQIVTFLWRAEGKPGHTVSNPFPDVADGGTFTDAILWAYENGITTGRTQSDGTVIFMPNDSCTRAQIVTFLYRDIAG